MGISSAHATAFYSEVAASKVIWTIRDAAGFPAPKSTSSGRAMPFWSSESRATLVVNNVSAYGGFNVVAISLEEFLSRWVPGLENDGLLAGLNWSGERATGYDVFPGDLLLNLEAACHP